MRLMSCSKLLLIPTKKYCPRVHTLYLPRLRVLKDRYMRSSCKGVNSVILGDGQHPHIRKHEQTRHPGM